MSETRVMSERLKKCKTLEISETLKKCKTLEISEKLYISNTETELDCGVVSYFLMSYYNYHELIKPCAGMYQ